MTGRSELQPLFPLDLNACPDIGSLLDHMADTSFGGRSVGHAWQVLRDVVCNRDCGVILTVSGAMAVAKLGPIFGGLISRGVVDVAITTGAIVTHSLVEETGLVHYRCPTGLSDEELFRNRLNRIFDSIEPEHNLELMESAVCDALSSVPSGAHLGSHEIIRWISSRVLDTARGKGLLSSALKYNTRLYVPALTDSELGLYLWQFLRTHNRLPGSDFFYDPLADVSDYQEWLQSQTQIALITIGGGVPRNWAQQLLPFLRAMDAPLPPATKSSLPEIVGAVRICPDDERLGHLSGCTYSEGISWGKFNSAHKANFVEVACDATICLPFLAKALFQHLDALAPPQESP